MSRENKKKGDKVTGKPAVSEIEDEALGHGAAADLAKHYLRNDKELNKAYPLSEQVGAPEKPQPQTPRKDR